MVAEIPLNQEAFTLSRNRITVGHYGHYGVTVMLVTFEYINGFYNPCRKHSALGWKSPLAFEKEAA